MSPNYPAAEQVPWGYGPLPTYYRAMNAPTAVVLHRQQGWASTARQWANDGHFGASWHFTVALGGHVMQHLRFTDGGYHAGIGSSAPAPTWPLWQGHGLNVNHYTIGIEAEGFVGWDWPEAQLAALKALCRWLADVLAIPYDRVWFPPHADIDVINRVNDFDTPERRDSIVFPYLFGATQTPEEDLPMTPEERAELNDVEDYLGGLAVIRQALANGVAGVHPRLGILESGPNAYIDHANDAALHSASSGLVPHTHGDAVPLKE